jgi:tRNA pseudouridine55 synthase
VNGFLVVDKPAGITSHDVVARVRRILGERRVGHAGTLDPPATGILLLGVGTTTRLLRFMEAYEKAYDGTVVLGASTTTQDATGEVVDERDASAITREDVVSAMTAFVGDIEQIPPMVSAVKVGGERLYRKALRGEEVERAPRGVTVHSFTLDDFTPGARARGTVSVVCTKGTYIRTLAADLGAALGVGAHLSSLRRTRIGPFDASVAVGLDRLSAADLRAPDEAIRGYPRRAVSAEQARDLVHGKALEPAGIDGPYAVFGPAGLVAMVTESEEEARSLCVVSGT